MTGEAGCFDSMLLVSFVALIEAFFGEPKCWPTGDLPGDNDFLPKGEPAVDDAFRPKGEPTKAETLDLRPDGDPGPGDFI